MIVAAALALWAWTASAADPVPAPLSSAPPAAATAPATDPPPRALPRVVTVCRSATTGRCWTLSGERTCAPAGAPYRVVPDRRDEVAAAIEACRAPAAASGAD